MQGELHGANFNNLEVPQVVDQVVVPHNPLPPPLTLGPFETKSSYTWTILCDYLIVKNDKQMT